MSSCTFYFFSRTLKNCNAINTLQRATVSAVRQYSPSSAVQLASCSLATHRMGLRQLPSVEVEMTTRSYVSKGTKSNVHAVQHDKELRLFYVDVDEKYRAFLEYELSGNLMKIVHTEVPSELEGRGLGRRLAKEALDYVQNNNLALEIHCEFVGKFVEKYEPKYLKYIQK